MPIDARTHFQEMRTRIIEYGGKWRGYFLGVSAAYAAAYASQERLLQDAKKAVEQRKQREQAALTTALTMLTLGVGGPVATHFASKFAAGATEVLRAANAEKILNWARTGGSAGKDLIFSDWIDKLSEATGLRGGNLSGDAYQPASVSPAEYGANLLQGAEERTNAMSDVARGWSESNLFSAQQAATMVQNMMVGDFFARAPSSRMIETTKDTLRQRAKLTVWIAHAHAQDPRYWTNENVKINFLGGSEVFDWEPVRQELVSLGVPSHRITTSGREGGGLPFGEWKTGLNYREFITWSLSMESVDAMFRGLPTDEIGMALVRNRTIANLALRQN